MHTRSIPLAIPLATTLAIARAVTWTALTLTLLVVAPRAGAAPPPIERHRLHSGLEVLVVENHALPLVTIEIGVKNGAMTEPPEYNGLSHLYEHMFFKANSMLPDQLTYMARTRELGMTFNGTTSDERVNYYFTTTSDHLDDAMAFMRDAITSPLFDEQELSRERVVVTGEIDRNEANPFYHFGHAVALRVWWKYFSRKWPIGTREAVLAATTDKMRTIQRRYYVPNNSVLVVVGDVNAQDVFTLADRLYAKWAAAEDPFVKYPLVIHPPIARSEVVVVEQPVKTVSLALNWIGPSVLGPDQDLSYAIDRMDMALREPSSKFQKALVDSGACVSAGFGWETAKSQGAVRLFAEAAPDKADTCARALWAELPKMNEPDYLSDEELANAVHRAEVDKARERERPSQFAHVLSHAWCVTGLDYYQTYIDRMRTAGRDDMRRFLDHFVLGRPFVLGALVSPEMRAQGMDRAHFEALFGVVPAALPPSAIKGARTKGHTSGKRGKKGGGR